MIEIMNEEVCMRLHLKLQPEFKQWHLVPKLKDLVSSLDGQIPALEVQQLTLEAEKELQTKSMAVVKERLQYLKARMTAAADSFNVFAPVKSISKEQHKKETKAAGIFLVARKKAKDSTDEDSD